jgi:hypothetical protein
MGVIRTNYGKYQSTTGGSFYEKNQNKPENAYFLRWLYTLYYPIESMGLVHITTVLNPLGLV